MNINQNYSNYSAQMLYEEIYEELRDSNKSEAFKRHCKLFLATGLSTRGQFASTFALVSGYDRDKMYALYDAYQTQNLHIIDCNPRQIK